MEGKGSLWSLGMLFADSKLSSPLKLKIAPCSCLHCSQHSLWLLENWTRCLQLHLTSSEHLPSGLEKAVYILKIHRKWVRTMTRFGLGLNYLCQLTLFFNFYFILFWDIAWAYSPGWPRSSRVAQYVSRGLAFTGKLCSPRRPLTSKGYQSFNVIESGFEPEKLTRSLAFLFMQRAQRP